MPPAGQAGLLKSRHANEWPGGHPKVPNHRITYDEGSSSRVCRETVNAANDGVAILVVERPSTGQKGPGGNDSVADETALRQRKYGEIREPVVPDNKVRC